MRANFLQSLRATGRLARPSPVFRPAAFQVRTYADAQATPEASPGTASNISTGNPVGSSQEASEVNNSRATDSKTGSPDTKSVQTPVSNPEQGGMGIQEEPQPSQENMKRDPNEPAESKRQAVEKEGMKPLDPADK